MIALVLVKRGYSVLLVEKRDDPRGPVHTEEGYAR